MDTLNDETLAAMKRVEDPNELPNMTLGEFMELSLIAYFSGTELNRETPVLYKGAYWSVHMCVSFVSPAEQIENLRNKQ